MNTPLYTVRCDRCNILLDLSLSPVDGYLCQQCQPAPVWWPVRQYRAVRAWFSRSYTQRPGTWLMCAVLTLYLSLFTMFWVVWLWR